MQDVRSPLTQTDRVTLIDTIPTADLVADWKRLDIDITGDLHGHQEIRLYRCDQTGLLFFWPGDIAGSAKLYEGLQKFAWYYAPHKWEYDAALRTLAGARRVLEIGCGDGAFVAKAMAAGMNILGIELNPQAVKVARQRGLPVELMDLADAARRHDGAMDAVCAFQVLEHVTDVRGFLEAAIRMVKPGGLLVLCVPNAEGYLREIPSRLDMPPHHMSKWSIGTFEALSQILPVDLVETHLEPLSAAHLAPYVAAKWSTYRRRWPYLAWLLNRPTAWFARLALRVGLRRFATGQSLYAVMKKRV
jgi:SAM-dependent methyltransferase